MKLCTPSNAQHVPIHPITRDSQTQSSITITTTTMPSSYTTIPISGTDVIFRSFQNVSSSLSLLRPWPDFLSSFDRPDSLHDAASRLRLNSKYFSVNYALITLTTTALSLLAHPKTLLIFSSLFALWLLLYFFREDPMLLWGHHVDDNFLTLALLFLTALAVWWMGFLILNLLIGVVVGLFICLFHGVFRNTRGVYLDEVDAVSYGLISPTSLSSN